LEGNEVGVLSVNFLVLRGHPSLLAFDRSL
jgi:hypothetical protein